MLIPVYIPRSASYSVFRRLSDRKHILNILDRRKSLLKIRYYIIYMLGTY